MPEGLRRTFDTVMRIAAFIFCVFAVLFLVLPYREPKRTVSVKRVGRDPVEINNPVDQSTWAWKCCEPPYLKDYAYCPHCGTHQRHVRFEQHLLRLENDPSYVKSWEVVEERLAREREAK